MDAWYNKASVGNVQAHMESMHVLPDGAIDLRLHIDGEVAEEQEVAPFGH